MTFNKNICTTYMYLSIFFKCLHNYSKTAHMLIHYSKRSFLETTRTWHLSDVKSLETDKYYHQDFGDIYTSSCIIKYFKILHAISSLVINDKKITI